jgi:hypothetical protein
MNRPVAAVVHCDVPRGHRGLATHSAHYDPATNTIGNGVF